jgi:hypothetical protein
MIREISLLTSVLPATCVLCILFSVLTLALLVVSLPRWELSIRGAQKYGAGAIG